MCKYRNAVASLEVFATFAGFKEMWDYFAVHFAGMLAKFSPAKCHPKGTELYNMVEQKT